MSTLVKTLASKPWLRAKDPFAEPVDVRAFPLANKKIGLLTFFFVASSLFMLFIVGYRLRMVYPDWAPLREPVTLWVNTGILVLASLALELARQALRKGNDRRARRAFIVGGAGSLLFLTGQLAAWQELSQSGFLVASNPASSFFYLLTGIHGIHIVGGLVAWARTLPHFQPGGDIVAARSGVDLCAIYWHFLLIIWAVLFYLLLSS